MRTIVISNSFPVDINEVWKVINDLTRCDWIPGVQKISIKDNIRSFGMEGMGKIKEKIIGCNRESKQLKYSTIETSVPIELLAIKEGCLLKWPTEIKSGVFALEIEKSMKVS